MPPPPQAADNAVQGGPEEFVQKHLFDDVNGDLKAPEAGAAEAAARKPTANGMLLAPGERPPFDPDAT